MASYYDRKDYSRPLHVDCSVEYELPNAAKPPAGARTEPLLMIHPCYYRRAESQRRSPFINNLPATRGTQYPGVVPVPQPPRYTKPPRDPLLCGSSGDSGVSGVGQWTDTSPLTQEPRLHAGHGPDSGIVDDKSALTALTGMRVERREQFKACITNGLAPPCWEVPSEPASARLYAPCWEVPSEPASARLYVPCWEVPSEPASARLYAPCWEVPSEPASARLYVPCWEVPSEPASARLYAPCWEVPSEPASARLYGSSRCQTTTDSSRELRDTTNQTQNQLARHSWAISSDFLSMPCPEVNNNSGCGGGSGSVMAGGVSKAQGPAVGVAAVAACKACQPQFLHPQQQRTTQQPWPAVTPTSRHRTRAVEPGPEHGASSLHRRPPPAWPAPPAKRARPSCCKVCTQWNYPHCRATEDNSRVLWNNDTMLRLYQV